MERERELLVVMLSPRGQDTFQPSPRLDLDQTQLFLAVAERQRQQQRHRLQAVVMMRRIMILPILNP
jgi:hypothetical protein